MKKLLSVILLIALTLLTFSACAMGDPSGLPDIPLESSGADVPPEATPSVNLSPLDCVVEYGLPAKLVDDGAGRLNAYISYPKSADFADKIIEAWARGIYADGKARLERLQNTYPDAAGEINIRFDAYFVNNRYLAVLEKGALILPSMENPEEIIKAFNFDLVGKKALDNSDIIDLSAQVNILSLLREQVIAAYPDTKNTLGELDKSWLSNLLIGHDGVVAVINSGKAAPAYLGAQFFTLPYNRLESAFIPIREPGEPLAPPAAYAPPRIDAPAAAPHGNKIDPSKPMLALTFDDGPSEYTPHILDLLERYNCRATFFVVGNLAENYKNTIKRAAALGCDVAGLSWSSRDLTRLSDTEIRQELINVNSAIESITGKTPKYFRPPYGAVNDNLKNVSFGLGQAIVRWSLDSLDRRANAADSAYDYSIYDYVTNNAADGAIILLHDIYGATAEAMDKIIPALIEKGYQLVTITELMEYSGSYLYPGTVYTAGK